MLIALRRQVAVQGDLVQVQIEYDLAAFQVFQAGGAGQGAAVQGDLERVDHHAVGRAVQGGAQGHLAEGIVVTGGDGLLADGFQCLIRVERLGVDLAGHFHFAGQAGDGGVAGGAGAGGFQQQVGDLRPVFVQIDIQLLLKMHAHRVGGHAGDVRVQGHRVEHEVVVFQVGGQGGSQVQIHAHVALVLVAQRHLHRERLFQAHVLGVEVEVLNADVGAVGGVPVADLAVGDGDAGDGQRNVHAAALAGLLFLGGRGLFLRAILWTDLLPVGAVGGFHQIHFQAVQGDAVHFHLAEQQRPDRHANAGAVDAREQIFLAGDTGLGAAQADAQRGPELPGQVAGDLQIQVGLGHGLLANLRLEIVRIDYLGDHEHGGRQQDHQGGDDDKKNFDRACHRTALLAPRARGRDYSNRMYPTEREDRGGDRRLEDIIKHDNKYRSLGSRFC